MKQALKFISMILVLCASFLVMVGCIPDMSFEPGMFLMFIVYVACGAIFAPALSLVWLTIDSIVKIIRND